MAIQEADVDAPRGRRRRDRRWRSPVVAVGLTGFGAFCAAWLVLTAPNRAAWLAEVVAREFSLHLIGLTTVGLGAAMVAWRVGARQTAAVAAVLGLVAISLAVRPPLEAREDALRHDVELSLANHLTGGLAFFDDVEPQTEVYARHADGPLHADVYLPHDAEGVVPAIVFVHGGAWRWGARSMMPRWNAWFNDHGYAVIDIDYRLDPPPTWRAATGDVQCAVGWVRQNAARLGIDPDQLVLMGSSAGGHLALLAAYTAGRGVVPPSCDVDRADVAAVVALYPPTDLIHSYELAGEHVAPLDGRAILERFTGTTPTKAPATYRMASPLFHVSSEAPPTFLAQGAKDRLQSPTDTVALARRLDEAGVDVRLLWFEHAGHAFHAHWGGWASQMTRPLLLDFLER